MQKLRWMGLGALLMAGLVLAAGLVVVLTVDRGSRLPGPPPGIKAAYPFGAIDLEELATDPDIDLQESIAESFRDEGAGEFDPDQDGVREYALLALSGGGSNGAFGAGFLCGWSEAGTRPDFKVVTGVSTGAFQAALAFLGPEYDHALREIYTAHDTGHIYVKRGMLAGLYNDALRDTSPLAALIARYTTKEVLAAIAAKHEVGHRLYVGTTNMDLHEFVVWDMGAIAASDRPDKLEHFRKILLASASVPVLFPPVYFPVDANGQTYSEMHTDGSSFAQVFFRGFLLDFDDAFSNAGVDRSQVETSLYIIRNGKADAFDQREDVPPGTLSIASETITNLFRITIRAGLYRMYMLAHRYGIAFNLAQIPAEYPHEHDPIDFEPEVMRPLFDLGFKLASEGYEWTKVPQGLDPDEVYTE